MRRKYTLSTIVSVEIILLMTAAAFFLPGGQDLHLYYRPLAAGCLDCGFTPYHASWLLAPLAWLPVRLVWPLLTLLTLSGLALITRRLGGNPLIVLLAFPTFAQVWLGQVDIVIAGGLALALLAENPYWRGAGLLLASIKPQTAGAAILVLLWHERDRRRALVIPLAAFLLSLIVFGPDWPLRWLTGGPRPPQHVWRMATLFPVGLLAFFAVPLLRGKRAQLTGALLASALGVPFYGSYAYVTFLPFLAPRWALPLSYLWVLLYPLEGSMALRFAWVLPLGLLLALLVRSRSKGEIAGAQAAVPASADPVQTP